MGGCRPGRIGRGVLGCGVWWRSRWRADGEASPGADVGGVAISQIVAGSSRRCREIDVAHDPLGPFRAVRCSRTFCGPSGRRLVTAGRQLPIRSLRAVSGGTDGWPATNRPDRRPPGPSPGRSRESADPRKLPGQGKRSGPRRGNPVQARHSSFAATSPPQVRTYAGSVTRQDAPTAGRGAPRDYDATSRSSGGGVAGEIQTGAAVGVGRQRAGRDSPDSRPVDCRARAGE